MYVLLADLDGIVVRAFHDIEKAKKVAQEFDCSGLDLEWIEDSEGAHVEFENGDRPFEIYQVEVE